MSTGEQSPPCSGNDDDDDEQHVYEVVIVGAGMAGLACARTLLEDEKGRCGGAAIHMTLLEATDRVGGRIRRHSLPSPHHQWVGELGAEYVHCRGHLLDQWIAEYEERGLLATSPKEEIFCLSQGDGGPDDQPTQDRGMYGMYYVGGDLCLYNDARIQPLTDALEWILHNDDSNEYTPQTSVQDALVQYQQVHGITLPSDLLDLCTAGYGNTVGCEDLSQIGIGQLVAFERYWEANEEEGDYRPGCGLSAVVDATMTLLNEISNQSSAHQFQVCLNSPVTRIDEPDDDRLLQVHYSSSSETSVQVEENESIQKNHNTSFSVDFVVVAVPPPILPTILPHLSPAKKEALSMIEFARAMKILCVFSKRAWTTDDKLQSVICANCDIPELWFQHLSNADDGSSSYLVTGFLTSKAADRIAKQLADCSGQEERNAAASDILCRQMATVFRTPLVELSSRCTRCVVYDWKEDHPYVQGGYVAPKVGMDSHRHLHALAEPEHGLFFAGEATNTNACSTVQAALETGQRAAQQVLQAIDAAKAQGVA